MVCVCRCPGIKKHMDSEMSLSHVTLPVVSAEVFSDLERQAISSVVKSTVMGSNPSAS